MLKFLKKEANMNHTENEIADGEVENVCVVKNMDRDIAR